MKLSKKRTEVARVNILCVSRRSDDLLHAKFESHNNALHETHLL